MSWFSDMFKAPSFDRMETDRYYDMANRYRSDMERYQGLADKQRDQYSAYNQKQFQQLGKMGMDQLAMLGQQGSRMAAQGSNPYANAQYGANQRRIQDSTLGSYNQYMQGQQQQALGTEQVGVNYGQLGQGYDQMGNQNDQYNSQMEWQSQQQAIANRQNMLGMGVNAFAGLGGGKLLGQGLGWLGGMFGLGGDSGFTNNQNLAYTSRYIPEMFGV